MQAYDERNGDKNPLTGRALSYMAGLEACIAEPAVLDRQHAELVAFTDELPV